MSTMRGLFKNKNVMAWVAMMSAIALHVADEAMTDFLPFYNQVVTGLRQRLGFFPMPTFSFRLWLATLIFLIAAGFAFTPVVARGGKLGQRLATVLAILMILNACGHMIGSVFLWRILPGFWSSPVLLAAAVFMLARSFGNSYWTPCRNEI